MSTIETHTSSFHDAAYLYSSPLTVKFRTAGFGIRTVRYHEGRRSRQRIGITLALPIMVMEWVKQRARITDGCQWVVLQGLIGLLITPSAWAVQTNGMEELFLTVGQQHFLHYEKPVQRISVGDAEIIRVRTLKRAKEVAISARNPGRSDLHIWHQGYKQGFTIEVLASHQALTLPALRKLLDGIFGIRLSQSNGKILIEGTLLHPSDRLRIRRLTKGNPTVQDLTSLLPEGVNLARHELRQQLNSAGFRSINIQVSGEKLYVRGPLPALGDKQRLESLVSTLFPDVVMQTAEPGFSTEMLTIDIHMVEVRKKALHNLGIDWFDAIQASGQFHIGTTGAQINLGNHEPFPLSLNLLQARGLARILANPKLTCRFESPCEFLAGGEIPIPLIGERSVRVEFKHYGIRLLLTPHRAKAQGGGREIYVDLEIEFSDIDQATAVNGVPGLLKNNLKTSAVVEYGSSLALSGLVLSRQSKNVEKLPFLGSLPMLGALFSSQSFTNDQSEFLLFLTPKPAGYNKERP